MMFTRFAVLTATAALMAGVAATDATAQRQRGAAMRLTISNQSCQWGPDAAPYIRQAIAQRVAATRGGTAREGASYYAPVPNRSWRGLTVVAFGTYYESTSVHFREPAAVVRRVLQQSGVRVMPDGGIPITNEEAVESQYLAAEPAGSRRRGGSWINCGV